MRKNSSQPLRRLRNNRWESHLQTFATSLAEDGYTRRTVQLKLGFLAGLEPWLHSAKLSLTDLDERLLESFFKRKRRERRGDWRTLQRFLAHLRRQNVVPARHLPCDRSPLVHILNRHETHLRTERGLVTPTIQKYQSFVRQFLLKRFRDRPLRLKAMKASDISDFVLRHAPSMNVKRAQLMTCR